MVKNIWNILLYCTFSEVSFVQIGENFLLKTIWLFIKDNFGRFSVHWMIHQILWNLMEQGTPQPSSFVSEQDNVFLHLDFLIARYYLALCEWW